MTEGPPGIHLRRPVRVESLNSQVDSLVLAFALRPRQPVQPCPQAPGLGPEGPEGPYQSPSVPCRHTYSHTAQQQILPLHTWSEGLAGGSHWGRGALPERLEDSSLRVTSPPLLSAQRAQTPGAIIFRELQTLCFEPSGGHASYCLPASTHYDQLGYPKPVRVALHYLMRICRATLGFSATLTTYFLRLCAGSLGLCLTP